MRVLITGASGFLGRHLLKTSSIMDPITLGRINSHINVDLSTSVPILPNVDCVIHAAGKAHLVPKSSLEKQDFFDVNVKGTRNLLEGLEKTSIPQKLIFISSVAVYGKEAGLLISESTKLEAKDAYGRSKIEAEETVTEWCVKNRVICTILRLPLLAGKNPAGNLGAMIKGIQQGYYFNVAGGTARKSMVMAEDVARFILPASEIGGVYNLTDGYHPSFEELSSVIASKLNKHRPYNIPSSIAYGFAKIGDIMGRRCPINSQKLEKILSDLTFDDTKARKEFGWAPRPVLEAIDL